MNAPVATMPQTVSRVALTWLLAGCVAGLVSAASLLAPYAGLPALAGYGRLMIVHLDVQLYGWCFIPLLALVLSRIFPQDDAKGVSFSILVWSAVLFTGLLTWLGGGAAGKVFLDWRGASFAALAAGMTTIWATAARAAFERRNQPGALLRFAGIATLGLGAIAFARSCNPAFLPPVNPDSGGATGHNLLASTLGFAVLTAGIARMLFPRTPLPRMEMWGTGAVFAGGLATYLVIRHGDVSHHGRDQVVGLAYTVFLGVALARFLRLFPWRSGTTCRWFVFWWMLVATDGVLLFLPGVLERAKFSDALVGHAHWAMAGIVTSLNFLILENLPGSGIRFGGITQCVWNTTVLAMGAMLTYAGFSSRPGDMPSADDRVRLAAYATRFVCGALMTGLVVFWLLRTYASPSDRGEGRRKMIPASALAAFGACDVMTGVCLATMPAQTLEWMRIPDAATTPRGPAGLIGVFVGSIGMAYLVQAKLVRRGGDPGVLKSLYWFTAATRAGVATYVLCSVIDGALAPAWLSVTATDATIAMLQLTLARHVPGILSYHE